VFRLLSIGPLLLLGACAAGAGVGVEKVPYHYRQSMIEPSRSDPLLGQPGPQAAGSRVGGGGERWDSRRCRRWIGRRFGGSRSRAVPRLVRACLGRAVPRRQVLRAEGLRLSSDGRPGPGDLLFFHNTADRNRNGRLDDRFTETGVVLQVSGDRVSFLYLRNSRARVGALNLARPAARRLRGGRIQNSYLRVITPRDPPRTPYLAGQLLAGFASAPDRL
jgi:hypothetical protein